MGSIKSPPPEPTRERRIRRHTIGYIATAILFSLVMAAILMPSWEMFWIALVLGVAYALLMFAPVFLGFITRDDDNSKKA